MNKHALSEWILARASGKILHRGPLSKILVMEVTHILKLFKVRSLKQ